jgi:Polyketide cyclase / dehydrase and lipid transport
MAGMQTTVVIDCPVEEVFHFFLNPKESAPRMDPLGGGLVLMSPDGPPGPGTTFVFRQQVFGKTRETKTHLTAVEPNRQIKFDAEIGPVRPACSLSFEPLASSTRVTFRGASNPPGGLRFLAPLMNRMGQKNWTQRFAQAKAVLEAPDE